MNFTKKTYILLIALCIMLGMGFIFFSGFDIKSAPKEVSIAAPTIAPALPKQFGLSVDSFDVHYHVIEKNQFLANILGAYQVDATKIGVLANKSRSIFNVRKISAGNPYAVFTYKNHPEKAAYFVYQPNPIDYIVYDLRDTLAVYAGKKDVTRKVETIAASIDNSLYDALQRNNADPLLAMQLAEIYGWAVDFYRIGKDDWFKIEYERQYVEDKPVSAGRIKSAIFSHKGKELAAYYFQTDSLSKGDYYDQDGNSVKRAFLKAPLKFSRITSRYTMKRLHPVQNVWKAHLGTDYAAPSGTPIIATGNGIVVESSFSKFNGNFVKVKHNDTYTTQYLHMSKRAVRSGQRVQQGQVIGYVGSTGLATGPHVCYRFWKNGKQVDALKQNFHESIPLPKEHLMAFRKMVEQKETAFAFLNINKDEAFTASNQTEPINEKTL